MTALSTSSTRSRSTASATRCAETTQEIALRLWTFVHGAASLLIDQDYDAIAPNIDVNQLIAGATPGLLASSPARAKR